MLPFTFLGKSIVAKTAIFFSACAHHDEDKAVLCGDCGLWHHTGCVGIEEHVHKALQQEYEDIPWFCPACQPALSESSTLNSHLGESVLTTTDNTGSSEFIETPKGQPSVFTRTAEVC